MRKVTVHVKTKLVILMDEGIEVDAVLADMDYDFTTKGCTHQGDADIIDSEIFDYEIIDSK